MGKEELQKDCFIAMEKFMEIFSHSGMQDFFCGENRVMYYIYTHKNKKVYPSDLSKELGFTRQRITSILNSLKRKKQLVTTPDIGDGRRTLVKLTETGEKNFGELYECVMSDFAFIIDDCGPDVINSFYNSLNSIIISSEKRMKLKK